MKKLKIEISKEAFDLIEPIRESISAQFEFDIPLSTDNIIALAIREMYMKECSTNKVG